MRMLKPNLTLHVLLAAFVLIWMSGSAQAVPVDVIIDGTVTEDATGAVGVGTTLSLTIHLDDSTPNEDSPPNYLATGNPGTLDSVLIIPVSGTIIDVTGTGSTSWGATGDIDLTAVLGVFFPLTISATGSGMTSGQILPDFTALTGGEIVVDVQAVFPGFVKADIDAITIIPEPTTVVLLGLGLVGLSAARRRRL